MNILFFIENLNNKGGTERVTTVIANALNNSKIIKNISILSINEGKAPEFTVNNNIEILSLECEKYNSLVKRFIVPRLLKKIIIDKKIDVVICVNVGMYIYVKRLQKLGYCKTVVWEHFNYYNQSNKREKMKKVDAAKLADAFVVLSDSDLKNYKENINKIKNINRIYNPVTIRSTSENYNREKKVIAVGRLVPQKGFDILIDVWKKVAENPISKDWTLEIYGDGPEKNNLEQKIKKLNLDSISLKNFNTNISQEYKKASIFVFSSRYEGFGLVLVEALANGTPVISFDIKEGPGEIITDNVNGYLIPPFDEDKMALKILSLMQNKKQLLELQKNTHYGLKKFSQDVVVQKWEKLLGDLFVQQ